MVNPETLGPPRGYSNGVLYAMNGARAGAARGLLFIAGQIGWDERQRLVGGGFAPQFEQALRNLLTVVTQAGGKPESIGKLTIFVTDRAGYLAAREAVGQAYRRHMGRYFPAMSLVEVKALVEPGALVEIEGIAVI